jgi:protocatechuate 3,4-dioxygenase beta subunit
MDFSADQSADVVIEAFSRTEDPRLRSVLTSLAHHLHAFVREVGPTMAEWEKVIDFLTRTGKMCDDTRQEFILLSDVLGVTMLVETLESERNSTEATPSTVLGPFHMVESPARALGDTIDLVGDGIPCVVEGRVTGTDGTPLPGATVDVWQADDKGFYDVQKPGEMPDRNGRGLFTTDADGLFWFRTVKPAPYPIPTDGPVGQLLEATSRHPNRPGHIHFIGAAKGHRPVTTHAFVADSDWIDSDAVFAVKSSLLIDFPLVDDAELATSFGVTAPFHRARFDIVLAPEDGA